MFFISKLGSGNRNQMFSTAHSKCCHLPLSTILSQLSLYHILKFFASDVLLTLLDFTVVTVKFFGRIICALLISSPSYPLSL
jgi:hypothetical protein